MTCPYCQSPRVYRASSLFLHLFRTSWDSNKRYCANCKKRWQSRTTGGAKPRLYSLGLLAVFFLLVLLVLRVMARSGAFNGFSSSQPISTGTPVSVGKPSSSKELAENLKRQKQLAQEMLQRSQRVERLGKQKIQ